jgi:glucan biosynthesis protein
LRRAHTFVFLHIDLAGDPLGVEVPEPADIRAYLRLGDKTLTETWFYQYIPFAW